MGQMDLDQIILKIQDIFRGIFNDQNIVLKRNSTAGDIGAWDSLEHVKLIMEIEKVFKIKFNVTEISLSRRPGENLESFSKMIQGKMN